MIIYNELQRQTKQQRHKKITTATRETQKRESEKTRSAAVLKRHLRDFTR